MPPCLTPATEFRLLVAAYLLLLLATVAWVVWFHRPTTGRGE